VPESWLRWSFSVQQTGNERQWHEWRKSTRKLNNSCPFCQVQQIHHLCQCSTTVWKSKSTSCSRSECKRNSKGMCLNKISWKSGKKSKHTLHLLSSNLWRWPQNLSASPRPQLFKVLRNRAFIQIRQKVCQKGCQRWNLQARGYRVLVKMLSYTPLLVDQLSWLALTSGSFVRYPQKPQDGGQVGVVEEGRSFSTNMYGLHEFHFHSITLCMNPNFLKCLKGDELFIPLLLCVMHV